jgi:hypothetical protein
MEPASVPHLGRAAQLHDWQMSPPAVELDFEREPIARLSSDEYLRSRAA